jgi:Zn-dependent protease
MFGPVRLTPYDVEFRLFRIPIRVLPWFWLMTVFLGWSWLSAGPLYLAIWMIVVFVSVLVHELGHALMAEAFGCPASIVLYHFGGLAMHHPGFQYTRRVRMMIIIAGPAAGLLLYGLVELLLFADWQLRFLPDAWVTSPLFIAALINLKFVNLFWSLFNLLPVYPLDGGQLCREICLQFDRMRGDRKAAFISLVTGIAAAAGMALYFHQPYAALMLAMMAFQSYEQLQER